MTDYTKRESQEYKDLSGYKDGTGRCDTCKHNNKMWYEAPCDNCCLAHSGWEKKDD